MIGKGDEPMKFLWRTKGVWFFTLIGIESFIFILIDGAKGDMWRMAGDIIGVIFSIFVVAVFYSDLKKMNSLDKK